MRKNRTAKFIFNGALLAVMAVLGVTAYQVANKSEHIQEVLPLESTKENDTADAGDSLSQGTDTLTETGTNLVEADMNEASDTGLLDSESLISDAALNSSDIGESTSVNAQVSLHKGPEVNFSEDTLMEWPVNGHVLIDYSMDQSVYFPTLDQYKLSPAISVQAVEGAPVVSAVNGTVYSIENDAETGTTVTMELGNGYQAIYGQLTDLDVAEGDTITKGSIIGYVAAPTKYYSEEGSNLYFAMKKDGEPIDPITYLP
nr:M23 family metallopeptidase [uncultured Blautia sp.]